MSIRGSNFLFFLIGLLLLCLCFSCKEESKSNSAHAFSNDLVHETSPYLLQHSHNPVNWRAWNASIFEEAQRDDKLVLISIGYSSCHWCHVMESETFEDVEVAQLMNEKFINIKVDREERPDVDQVYQTAIQLIGQGGGWPLNVIALPNGKPLYLGTYLPKKQWNEVLTKVNQLYTDDPAQANEYANQLAAGIQETNVLQPSTDFEKLTIESLQAGVNDWKNQWDLEFGGNKIREKFMIPSGLSFLLDYGVLLDDEATLSHVQNTLNQMADGGLFDHLGGGFYRYSTDAEWKVPHFEKMLYDNAQAISLYSKAYKVFKDPLYKKVVYQSIEFLENEMKHDLGGFYATLNADSEGEEGKYYIWTKKELQEIIGDDFAAFADYFNINEASVWEEDKYILNTTRKEPITESVDTTNLKLWKKNLLTARSKRVHPTKDDKIITSWNALLISGYVDAYKAFGNEAFLKSAKAIYEFIKTNSYKEDHLLHSYKKDSKRKEGFLEDYSFLIAASLKLYEVTLQKNYLEFAQKLNTTVKDEYTDKSSGMFAFSNEKNLISKIIKTNDGDLPSPNSVMAQNLFLLGHLDYNAADLNQAKTMLTTVLPYVIDYTDGYAKWSSLFLNTSQPFFEIVVVGKDAEEIVKELQSKHLPNALIVGSTKDSNEPLFKDRFVENETFIYVCQNSTCKLPVKSIDDALNQMKNF